MLGAIIGDIVGSRFEFNNSKNLNFKLFAGECSFTDDTICTIAVADAILNNKNYKDSLLSWCRKYPRPMGGYGGSFGRWVFSDTPQPYNSFGNGSAMRVSPIGWLFDDYAQVEYQAALSAEVTHNHPEGIKGAQIIALCVRMLLNGCKKENIADFVTKEYGKLPLFIPFSNPFNETCMNAVPVSVACFIASTDFEDAIRKAVVVGGDSDTIGAITGCLAEAYYGIPVAIRAAGLGYLPDMMKNIVSQFYTRVYEKR